MSDAKVWEETWRWEPSRRWNDFHAPPVTGHSGNIVFPDDGAALIKYDPANYDMATGAARGRLAAAAPDLARAITSALSHLGPGTMAAMCGDEDYQAAKAALLKAGVPLPPCPHCDGTGEAQGCYVLFGHADGSVDPVPPCEKCGGDPAKAWP